MNSKTLALIAILAALYCVCSLLPGFPVIGVTGSKIDFVRAFDIFYGVLLGPVYGPLAAFLGSFSGKILVGGGFGVFLTPLAPVTAFVAAGLCRDKILGVKGWLWSFFVMFSITLGWFLTDIGKQASFYPIIHFLGLLIIISSNKIINKYLRQNENRYLAISALLISIPSTFTGHMLGNIIFISFFSTTPEFFMSILPISIIERTVIASISTIIISGSLFTIYRIFPELKNI